jgi:VWFA-related protein
MTAYSRPSSRCFVLAAASALLVACNTQQSPANQVQVKSAAPGAAALCAAVTSDAPESLQKKPGYQQVAVVVRDASGHELRNLGKDDFIVGRGDSPLAVQFVEWMPSGPESVLILADTSGSTGPTLSQTREAITQVVNNLDPRDDVSLFAFSGRPYSLQPFTRDHSAIIKQETSLHSFGSTSLYDSVDTAGFTLQSGCYARRILVVISDGIDNTSSKSLQEAAHHITLGGISAYAIAIGSADATASSLSGVTAFVTNSVAGSVDEKSLGILVDPSGGSTFLIGETGDRELLRVAAKSIVDGSRGQYVVGFMDESNGDLAGITIGIKNRSEYGVFRQKSPPSASAQESPLAIRTGS